MASITHALQQIKTDLSCVLSQERIAELCRQAGHSWRTRLLDPAITIQIFILQILHGNAAMTNLPRLVGRRFTAAAYCLARQRLPIGILQALVRRLADTLQEAGDQSHRWRGHRTFFVDGTSCSMPDTPDLQEHFGQPSGQKPGCGFPVAHLLILCNAGTGMIVDLLASSWRIHDLTRMGELHPSLQAGDVLVGDRGFCSYAHLALLFKRKVHALFRVHQRIIVDFTPYRPHATKGRVKGKPRSLWLASLGVEDQLVVWRKPARPPRNVSAEVFATLPDCLVLRELRYRIGRRGFRTRQVTLVTTLLDPVDCPSTELAELYGARWRIEVNFRHLKQTLGMDILKSKTVDGVRKELLVFTLVYNLVCQVMCERAAELGVPAARVSFMDAWRALAYASCGGGATDVMVNPDRAGRFEPRVMKRRPKKYPWMKKPRQELRKDLLDKDLPA